MWLSRQQILTRLARWFHVIWVNPAEEWRRLWPRRENRVIGLRDPASPPANLHVERQSRLHPRVYQPSWLADRLRNARIDRAARHVNRLGCTKTVLYTWRPEHIQWVDRLKPDATCYHIADEYSFSAVEHPIPALERDMIERADDVFIHSPGLMEKKGRINPNTMFVTNGVDYERFADPCPEPRELRSIPHPRVGYVGRMKTQIDWDVLGRLAEELPDVSLVLVGPVGYLGDDAGAMRQLASRANVYVIGAQPAHAVPAFMQHLDAGLMPYRVNDYTKYIYPLKLHEFLASGTPVVCAPIRSLIDFRGVAIVADDRSAWAQSVSMALDPLQREDDRVAARQSVAREFDWNRITEKIAERIIRRLALDTEHQRFGVAAPPGPHEVRSL